MRWVGILDAIEPSTQPVVTGPPERSTHITCIESCGPIFQPLQPRWIVDATIEADAAMVCLVRPDRNGRWHQQNGQLLDRDAAWLLGLYRATGIDAGECEVECQPDTSDTGSALSICASGRERAASLYVPMMHSGFTGRDADKLRAFVRAILDVADPSLEPMCLPHCYRSPPAPHGR